MLRRAEMGEDWIRQRLETVVCLGECRMAVVVEGGTRTGLTLNLRGVVERPYGDDCLVAGNGAG